MPNEEALQERLDALTEELIALKAASETASTTSAITTTNRKLDNLDLDSYPTADKKLSALDAWVVRAERVFHSRKLRDPKLTEAMFTDELCDYIGKSQTLKTYLTSLWRLSMSSTLTSIASRHHADGQGRSTTAFKDAKEDEDDIDAATNASTEPLKEPPQTIGALYNIILRLYRFKPSGVDALKEFTEARQKNRTPSEFLAYLQELASKTLYDTRVEPLTEGQVFFKFKSSLWLDIQRGITSLKEKDILDGKTDRDLNDLDEYVRVAEYIYDQVKNDVTKKPSPTLTKDKNPKDGASSSSKVSINNVDASKERRVEITKTPTIGYVAVKFADLTPEKKEAISLFQQQHKAPLKDTADKESAKRLGLCYRCLKYGHIAANCKVDTGKAAITNVSNGGDSESKNGSG